jgi:hypothetical protein
MVIVPIKETRIIIPVDDLDFRIKDVAFDVKALNRYGTFDQIANRNMEDPNNAYLHCDLLDRAALTIINLKNRFTLNCMNNICKKHVCEGEFFWH